MEFLAGALGFTTALLGLVLAFITLWTKIRNGIKAAAREVLVEAGLINPNEEQPNWPNGYDNLPDVLHELHQIMVEIRNHRER